MAGAQGNGGANPINGLPVGPSMSSNVPATSSAADSSGVSAGINPINGLPAGQGGTDTPSTSSGAFTIGTTNGGPPSSMASASAAAGASASASASASVNPINGLPPAPPGGNDGNSTTTTCPPTSSNGQLTLTWGGWIVVSGIPGNLTVGQADILWGTAGPNQQVMFSNSSWGNQAFFNFFTYNQTSAGWPTTGWDAYGQDGVPTSNDTSAPAANAAITVSWLSPRR